MNLLVAQTTEILTADEMRRIELKAIRSGRVAGAALMERAGRGIVTAIGEVWPSLATAQNRRAIVLCGPGNNGGD